MISAISVRPFARRFQVEAKALLLAGLAEHWGLIDESLNEDLADIDASFAGHVFLLAIASDGAVVGAGGLRVRDGEGELVRMSVRSDHRRCGVGRHLAESLCDAARAKGLAHVVLETQATWTEVRTFYERLGFELTHYAEGPFGADAWYRLDLSSR